MNTKEMEEFVEERMENKDEYVEVDMDKYVEEKFAEYIRFAKKDIITYGLLKFIHIIKLVIVCLFKSLKVIRKEEIKLQKSISCGNNRKKDKYTDWKEKIIKDIRRNDRESVEVLSYYIDKERKNRKESFENLKTILLPLYITLYSVYVAILSSKIEYESLDVFVTLVLFITIIILVYTVINMLENIDYISFYEELRKIIDENKENIGVNKMGDKNKKLEIEEN